MKLFLLVGPELDDYWLETLDPVLRSPQVEVVGACIDAQEPEPLLRRTRAELRKGRGGFVIVMAFRNLTRRGAHRSTADYLRENGVDVLETVDLYAQDTIAYIRSRDPDCLFRNAFGLIREPVLSLAPKGVISYHHGDIRHYRGQPVAFWEIHNGEREMGVTVQILCDKLDAGKIVVERSVPVRATDSWRALERRAYALSSSMALAACLLLADPSFTPSSLPESELGALYTLPNLKQWLVAQWRVTLRRLGFPIGRRRRAEPDSGAHT